MKQLNLFFPLGVFPRLSFIPAPHLHAHNHHRTHNREHQVLVDIVNKPHLQREPLLPSTSHPPPVILPRGRCWHWCFPGCVAGSWFSPLWFPQLESVWPKASVPASTGANARGGACVLRGSVQDRPEPSHGCARGAWFWLSRTSGWGSWRCSCRPRSTAQNPPGTPRFQPGGGSGARGEGGTEGRPLRCWEACPRTPGPGPLRGRRSLEAWGWPSCEVTPCSPPPRLLHFLLPPLRCPHFRHFRPGRCWRKGAVEPSPGHSRYTGRLERHCVVDPVVSADLHLIPS